LLRIEQAAFEHADVRRREIERLAREQQVDRIAVRKATLRRTFRARIERKREIQNRVQEERILRLYDGQIRNLEAELTRQLDELDRAPEPSADLEMLSMALFSRAPERVGSR
jgi:hypothetical protein